MKKLVLAAFALIAMTSMAQAMDVCGVRWMRNMYGQVVPVRICRSLIPNNVWGQDPRGPHAVIAPLGRGVSFARPATIGRRVCIAWPCY